MRRSSILESDVVANQAHPDRVAEPVTVVDRHAFDQLVRPLIDPAYRLAFALLRQRESAEDAVQEASLRAWARLAQFRDQGGGFRAWFLTIVANECRSVRRGRWWSVLRLPEIPPRAPASDTATSASELRESIRRLSHNDRVLLYLFYWLDLPLEEVAVVLGISAKAAKARLYRAVGRLRLQIDPNQENAQ